MLWEEDCKNWAQVTEFPSNPATLGTGPHSRGGFAHYEVATILISGPRGPDSREFAVYSIAWGKIFSLQVNCGGKQMWYIVFKHHPEGYVEITHLSRSPICLGTGK